MNYLIDLSYRILYTVNQKARKKNMATGEQTLEQFRDEVVESMKKYQGKWQRMFGDQLDAINSTTDNRYRGVNQLILSFKSKKLKFKNNIWASYKQWQSIGGQVKTGSKGTGIVFYKPAVYVSKKTGNPVPSGTILDDKVSKKSWSVLRGSTVFNVDQVDL